MIATKLGMLGVRPRRREVSTLSGAVGVAVCSTVWAVVFLISHNYLERPPAAEQALIGIHLALGHGFLSPMDLSSTAPPSAWSAPIYPWLISIAYRAFGVESPQAVTFLMLVNSLCFGAVSAGFYSLGRILFLAHAPGVLAALMIALHPLYLFYAGDFWDGMLSLAIFVWLTVFAVSRNEHERQPWSWSAAGDVVVFGMGMGLLALTNPTYSVAYPVLLAVAFPPRLQFRRWLLAGGTLLVLAGVLVPWTIRNVAVFGRLFYVRTALELNLWLGSEPLTQGWLDDPRSYALQPLSNGAERALVLTLGEPGYDDLCWERFVRNYLSDPGGYWVLAARKFGYLVVGNPLRPTPYRLSPSIRWHNLFLDHLLMNGFFAVTGVMGMIAAWRMGMRGRGVLFLPFFLSLPCVLAGMIERYGLAFRALLILYSAFFLWRVVAGIKAKPPAARDFGYLD